MFVILDYGVGNLTSIQNMLKKAGVSAVISNQKEDIPQADKLMLPGMGHFDNCMQKFNQSGMRPLVEKMVFEKKTPLLGICVGLQMFMRSSEEGKEPGLDWVAGNTIRFQSNKMQPDQKVPNMGWLDIQARKPSRLLQDLNGARFYYAHSYHVQPDDSGKEIIAAHYGYDFTAAIEQGNIVGVQFHPEKSHRFGMQLLKNFALNY